MDDYDKNLIVINDFVHFILAKIQILLKRCYSVSRCAIGVPKKKRGIMNIQKELSNSVLAFDQ